MLYHAGLMLEYIAIIVTLQRIYNRKVCLNIDSVGLCLMSLTIVELVRYYGLSNLFTIIIYILIGIYCVRKYNDSVIGSIVSVLLLLIVIVVLQYIAIFPCSYFFSNNLELQMLSTNGLVLAAAIWILPLVRIHKLHEIFMKRDTYIAIILGTVMAVILMIMLEDKIGKQIHLAFFTISVPMLIVLLWGLSKWHIANEEAKNSKNELSLNRTMQGKYEDLLTSVRLREHGFKNHLAALLSIKYTSRSYEELVAEQERYYSKICDENKYNKLLYLKDSVVIGFLYEKFRVAETMGVKIRCDIKGTFSQCVMPTYHLIDILGILIDNAVEAQESSIEIKQLKFQFMEKEVTYIFTVSNPYLYVSYAEIQSWFQIDKSSKGKHRGLGLFNVKELCEKYDANIVCRNKLDDSENWVEFTLEIAKADK